MSVVVLIRIYYDIFIFCCLISGFWYPILFMIIFQWCLKPGRYYRFLNILSLSIYYNHISSHHSFILPSLSTPLLPLCHLLLLSLTLIYILFHYHQRLHHHPTSVLFVFQIHNPSIVRVDTQSTTLLSLLPMQTYIVWSPTALIMSNQCIQFQSPSRILFSNNCDIYLTNTTCATYRYYIIYYNSTHVLESIGLQNELTHIIIFHSPQCSLPPFSVLC